MRLPIVEDPPVDGGLLVGLVTEDVMLVQGVTRVAAQGGASVAVAKTRADAAEFMRSTRYALKVLDGDAKNLMSTAMDACAGCAWVQPMMALGELALLAHRRDTPGRVASTMTANLYRRDALGSLLEDLAHLLPGVRGRAGSDLILGDTPAIQLVRDQVRSVAQYHDVPVFILGETGTGKELVAQAIHDLGTPGRPFVAINCAAIPENLFESELFGHEAGAYTGARTSRVGLLEAAASGTVFFDEIGEMPVQVQAKLLRVLETRAFRRVGANRDVPLLARVISATNRGIGAMSEVTLRSDLLYRLAGFTITLPALRARASDVDMLANAFLRAFVERHRVPQKRFSDDALALLRAQAWWGNVRELRALVEHVAILSPGVLVTTADVQFALARLPRHDVVSSATSPFVAAPALPAPRPPSTPPPAPVLPRANGLRDLERELILAAFHEHEGNLSRAARQLAIPRSTLRDKLRRYGVL